ncbi:hypothetical protein Afe04nite_10050 [Asanoa ferruginea]|nr:hypothetical protein Afe04nite_10050 [Asanoa ferruginea]
MPLVAVAQRGDMAGDLGRRGRREIVDPTSGERDQITIQIATVRRERVAGQPPLDGEVVEVGADRTAQRR